MKKIIGILFPLLLIVVIALVFYYSRATRDLYPLQLKQLQSAHVPEFSFQVQATYAHNTENFTEGLLLDQNALYESTGLYQYSNIQKINLQTGRVMKKRALSPTYFGEGITLIGDNIYQLTYREETGFVYNKKTFALVKTFHYNTQGWGLTTDGQSLIMSDGTSTLTYLDPTTFRILRTLSVQANHTMIEPLNALSYHQHIIYANVWLTDIIVMIASDTGQVVGWINIQSLHPQQPCVSTDGECEANGIAYDERDNTLLVTGKNWPWLFRIKLEPHAPPT